MPVARAVGGVVVRRGPWVATVATVLVAVTLVMVRSASPADATAVRVMPLGDSITGTPGCWRAMLWNDLRHAGFGAVNFVGTRGGTACGAGYDGDNEGHGGFRATGIVEKNQLPGWLHAARPDVVLMHLGTNDVWHGVATAAVIDAYGTLVEQMRASNPDMKILVAQIIPMNPPNCRACAGQVAALNAEIPAWAARHSTARSPIVVVDQWTGFDTAADTSDGVHPNAVGNRKLSARWLAPLAAQLDAARLMP